MDFFHAYFLDVMPESKTEIKKAAEVDFEVFLIGKLMEKICIPWTQQSRKK